MKKILITAIFIVLNSPLFAFDLNDLGDFSSRSLIESRIYNNQLTNQEQRDALVLHKLAPTHKCLFEQIIKGNYENVKLLLEANINPNQSYMSEYAIYISAKHNKFDILKLLYENNAKLDRGFYSELYEAIRNKNPEMAQYLLDRGARVNYIDSVTNNTVLYLALKNKMYDLDSQMIQKGAKADPRSVNYLRKHKLGYLVEQKN